MNNPTPWHGFSYEPGPIHVEGAVFDDFRLTEHLPAEKAPAVIERDRLFMAARPGFNRKLLPLRVDPTSGLAYSGGRYLLDTYENAVEFARWVTEDFVIDGTLILDRPDFAEVTAHVWRVIGAYDFTPLETTQKVMRVERFSTTGGGHRWLQSHWAAIRDRAEGVGMASVWLLDNEAQQAAALVTVADQVTGAQSAEPDFASVKALEGKPSLVLDGESSGQLERVFDRTSWVFTIWRPYRQGEQSDRALWPNSPPLPGAPARVDTAA